MAGVTLQEPSEGTRPWVEGSECVHSQEGPSSPSAQDGPLGGPKSQPWGGPAPIVHEEAPACLSLTAGRLPAVALARGPRPLSPGFASVEADSLPLGPRGPLLLGPGLQLPGRSAGAHVAP